MPISGVPPWLRTSQRVIFHFCSYHSAKPPRTGSTWTVTWCFDLPEDRGKTYKLTMVACSCWLFRIIYSINGFVSILIASYSYDCVNKYTGPLYTIYTIIVIYFIYYILIAIIIYFIYLKGHHSVKDGCGRTPRSQARLWEVSRRSRHCTSGDHASCHPILMLKLMGPLKFIALNIRRLL